MKNKLSDLYTQILLSEAEKSALQTPSNDTVGSVKNGQELFGEKPKVTDTGKVKGETPKKLEHETSEDEDVNPKTSEKNVAGAAAPAKSAEETEGSKSKPKGLGEEVTMGAFETLFRKTLVIEEEENETLDFEAGSEAPSEEGSAEHEASETEEEEVTEEEEEDLLADLRKLQTHVTDIITKLEKAVEDESGETTEDAGYSEEDFNEEFGEEEAPESEESEEEVKTESLKVLGDKKKVLQSKNNKVGGKVNPKGGKANTGKYPKASELKPLGDKKKALQSGTAVKSSLKKGDSFIK